MNYQLVSIATILRDYIDVAEDVGYLNDEHEKLVDIADGLYNTPNTVTDMTPNYQTIYYKQTPEFWALVFKDINAIDSQVNTHSVHDLLDDYKALMEDEVK